LPGTGSLKSGAYDGPVALLKEASALQTYRHTDVQTSGRADVQTCRHTGVQTYRGTDVRTCRCTERADVQTCRRRDAQTASQAYAGTDCYGSTSVLLAVMDNSTLVHGKLRPGPDSGPRPPMKQERPTPRVTILVDPRRCYRLNPRTIQ